MLGNACRARWGPALPGHGANGIGRCREVGPAARAGEKKMARPTERRAFQQKRMATACWAFIVAKSPLAQASKLLGAGSLRSANRLLSTTYPQAMTIARRKPPRRRIADLRCRQHAPKPSDFSPSVPLGGSHSVGWCSHT